jgi:hypothetical protein
MVGMTVAEAVNARVWVGTGLASAWAAWVARKTAVWFKAVASRVGVGASGIAPLQAVRAINKHKIKTFLAIMVSSTILP